MHLFKQFWKLLGKNKASIIIYGSISLVMVVLVGISAADNFKSDKEESYEPALTISYIDNDKSALSKGLIDFFSDRYDCMDLSGKTDEQISDLAYFTITKFHMNIPENFQQRLSDGDEVNVECLSSASEASYSSSCSRDVDTFVNSFLSYKKLGFSDDEAVSRTSDSMSEKLEMSTYSEGKILTSETAVERVIYQLVVYMFYISFGLICLTAGMAIVKINEELVKKRIAASSVSTEKLTLANTLGIYSFGLLIWAVVSAAMLIVGNGVDTISNRGWIISLGLLVMIISNCSITVMIAAFGPRSNTMSMVVNVVCLSFSFLGGVFVPQWLLSNEVIAVAKFLPSYWSTYAFNMCFPNSGAGLSFEISEVFKCYGIELLFAVVFVMVAVVIKRVKAQK